MDGVHKVNLLFFLNILLKAVFIVCFLLFLLFRICIKRVSDPTYGLPTAEDETSDTEARDIFNAPCEGKWFKRSLLLFYIVFILFPFFLNRIQ